MPLNHIVKLSGALILTAGLTSVASANNFNGQQNGYNAHEACKASEDRSQLLGGGIGAVAGAVIGSQVAGRGARTEASVIGGVLGGLAGVGIADKSIDCDPVFHDTPAHAPSRTYSSSSPSYGSGTTQSGSYNQTTGYHQTASYPQEDYGTRVYVSDHPVYSNPTYGAQPARTYTSQTVTQPVRTVSQPVYQQATYQQASYGQPRHLSSQTHYVRPAQTTTYVQPTSYVQPTRVTRRRSVGHRPHYHGKFSCSDWH